MTKNLPANEDELEKPRKCIIERMTDGRLYISNHRFLDGKKCLDCGYELRAEQRGKLDG